MRLSRAESAHPVYWTIWCSDSWTAVGAQLPKQLIAHPNFPKPMEEVMYEAIVPGTRAGTVPESPKETVRLRNSGLWAQMLPLTEMMSEVKELQESIVPQGRPIVESLDQV